MDLKYLLFFIALVTGLKADMIIPAIGNRMPGTIMEITERYYKRCRFCCQ